MYYPPFLSRGNTIGVTAPSAGISDEHSFDASLRTLRKQGYKILETASVRSGTLASTSGQRRAVELRQLITNNRVHAILCAAGGDFLIDMLPYVDFAAIRQHPKWIQGFSDPTGLLFPVTVNLDIATLYGPTAGQYSATPLHKMYTQNLDILRGEIPVQESFSACSRAPEDPVHGLTMTDEVHWIDLNGPVHLRGRIIGGCMDCLQLLIGTPYADVAAFNRRYAGDGVIWYFDIFSLRAEQVYNTLWQMREAGWFSEAAGFLFGRVCFPGSDLGMQYEDAVLRALGSQAPVLLDVDIGHVQPTMTIINGAMAEVWGQDGRGAIALHLE